eukprot:TRINITY_DN785_c0_g1_i2.p1 TRINITY_DN785_c0_g1~~TRINITY_DN785_c0_g1_i2.p1  ORF type:complete len:387 (-),score=79.27 TRINITY_DN785_c0_g1_i2:43-1161(-)
MMKHLSFLVVFFCLFQSISTTVIFNGNLNTMTNFDTWGWGNQVGEWQTYIYGNKYANATASTYLKMSPSFKNPADTVAQKGVEVRVDATSFWSGQNMERTEMIPNLANSNYQNGKIYYKWSMKQTTTNPLRTANEHQLVFFESHFCDIKYGGSSGDNLAFFANGNSVWSTPFTKGTWFNFAIEVDYSAKTVALYQSTGNANLARVSGPTAVPGVSPSDFHIGILRLPENGVQDPTAELLYYSGMQVVTTVAEANPGNGVDTNPTSNTPTSSSAQNPTSSTTRASSSTTRASSSSTSRASSPSTTVSQNSNVQTSSKEGNCDDRNYCVNTCGKGNVVSCSCVQGSLVAICADQSGRVIMAPFAFLLFVILLSI